MSWGSPRRVLGTAALTAVMLAVVALTRPVPQPVPYSHKQHVDMGVACAACHIGSTEQARATTPNVKTCALCHVPGKENPPTPPGLENYLREGRSIPWKRVYRLDGHVRFSHERHVAFGGLDCRSCHGDVGSMEEGIKRQAMPITMNSCMECHRKKKVTTNCLSCHR